MNITALKSMRAYWPQMMAALLSIREAYLQRFPTAQSGWTVGGLEALSTVGRPTRNNPNQSVFVNMSFQLQPVKEFLVLPALPKSLSRLSEIAHNLVWSWDHTIRAVFRRLDPVLWKTSGHNPVLMLGHISQSALEKAAKAESPAVADLQIHSRAVQDHVAHAGKRPDA